jgi:hypothetical protein
MSGTTGSSSSQANRSRVALYVVIGALALALAVLVGRMTAS